MAEYNEDTELQTQTFRLRISRHTLQKVYISLKDGYLNIVFPQQTDIRAVATQKFIRQTVINALRFEAKRVLPPRLAELSAIHGFTFTAVHIKNSRSRWGSCSNSKSINLSLSVMLLPQELSDYVLLHELCHTQEMNHGERFWALMDKVTGGKAKVLRQRLKQHKML